MGDVVSLVEKAQETFGPEESARIAKKFRKNQFDFNDFLRQLEQVKRWATWRFVGHDPRHGQSHEGVDINDDSFKTGRGHHTLHDHEERRAWNPQSQPQNRIAKAVAKPSRS